MRLFSIDARPCRSFLAAMWRCPRKCATRSTAFVSHHEHDASLSVRLDQHVARTDRVREVDDGMVPFGRHRRIRSSRRTCPLATCVEPKRGGLTRNSWHRGEPTMVKNGEGCVVTEGMEQNE